MKTMNLNKILLLLLTVVVCSACVQDDDFATPKVTIEEPILDLPVITIDDLMSNFNQEFLGYIDSLGLDPDNFADQEAISELKADYVFSLENNNSFVSGYVISSDEGGNYFEEIIIQNNADNGSAGIRILIDVNPLFTRYQFGQLIYVRLPDLHFGNSNGVLTLGISEALEKITSPSEEDFLKRSPQIEEIIPTEIEFSDFSNNFENVFIKLNNVQFNRDLVLIDTIKTFAGEETDEFDGERLLESCATGANVIFSTSTFADFKSLKLPSGQGSLNCILSRDFFGEAYNVVINSPEDISFGGEENRCDPIELECGLADTTGTTNLFEDDFEGQSVNQLISGNGWTNFIEAGSEGWEAFTAGGTNASQGVSARVGAFNSGDAQNIAWLITPQIDLDTNTGTTLNFETSTSFSDGSTMEILFSNDWDGTQTGITSASWGLVSEAYVAQNSDFFGDWLPSNNVDLSCGSGQIYIAFKYIGSGESDFDGTYELDFVSIDAQ